VQQNGIITIVRHASRAVNRPICCSLFVHRSCQRWRAVAPSMGCQGCLTPLFPSSSPQNEVSRTRRNPWTLSWAPRICTCSQRLYGVLSVRTLMHILLCNLLQVLLTVCTRSNKSLVHPLTLSHKEAVQLLATNKVYTTYASLNAVRATLRSDVRVGFMLVCTSCSTGASNFHFSPLLSSCMFGDVSMLS
jgi:hypothetical protein